MKITVSHDAVTSHRLRRITLKLMLLGKTFKTQGETNCCCRHRLGMGRVKTRPEAFLANPTQPEHFFQEPE